MSRETTKSGSMYVPIALRGKLKPFPTTMPKDPITVAELAQALQLRRGVVSRMVRLRRANASLVKGRFYLPRAEIARLEREQPWAPWAGREYRNRKGEVIGRSGRAKKHAPTKRTSKKALTRKSGAGRQTLTK
jgi:hypothetical protein